MSPGWIDPVASFAGEVIKDPYGRCESRAGCNHSQWRGILVTDLIGGDGPYEASNHWELNFTGIRNIEEAQLVSE